MSQISTEKQRITSLWQNSALHAASPIVLALEQCEDELCEEAIELFKQRASGELTPDEEFATVTPLAESLFPNRDDDHLHGYRLAFGQLVEKVGS